jgi:hypothetical protein
MAVRFEFFHVNPDVGFWKHRGHRSLWISLSNIANLDGHWRASVHLFVLAARADAASDMLDHSLAIAVHVNQGRLSVLHKPIQVFSIISARWSNSRGSARS